MRVVWLLESYLHWPTLPLCFVSDLACYLDSGSSVHEPASLGVVLPEKKSAFAFGKRISNQFLLSFNMTYSKYPKLLYTKVYDKMTYANRADPDQTTV